MQSYTTTRVLQRAAASVQPVRHLTVNPVPLPTATGLNYVYRNPFVFHVENRLTYGSLLREKKLREHRRKNILNGIKQAKETIANQALAADTRKAAQERLAALESKLNEKPLPPWQKPVDLKEHKRHKALQTYYESKTKESVSTLLKKAMKGHAKYDRAVMETYIWEVGQPRAIILLLDFGLTRADINVIRGICKATADKGIHARLQQRSNRFFLPLLRKAPQLKAFNDIYEEAGQYSRIVVCDDPIEGAKLADAIRTALPTKVMPWGGVFDGYPLSYEAMHAFKDLPDTETMQGMAGAMVAQTLASSLLATLTAPLTAVPNLLRSPISHLARTLQATEADRKAQDGTGAAPPASA